MSRAKEKHEKAVREEFSRPASKVHQWTSSDNKFQSAKKLRDLGWNVEPCTDENCGRCRDEKGKVGR